jgi:diguanylate cyclase (GGDEF)-like protein
MKNSLFTQFSNSVLSRLTTPGHLPKKHIVLGSYASLALVWVLERFIDTTIPFHIFYFLPLVSIVFHSVKRNHVMIATSLFIVLQCITIGSLDESSALEAVLTFLTIAVASVVFVLTLRQIRASILESEHCAATDSLTQLLNRRSLDRVLNAEIIRQRRYGGCFAVVMIDLDGFKGLNDKDGHDAGDKALQLLAEILRNQTRESDTVARLGGDEFAIVMPNTQAAHCDRVCQSICDRVGERLTQAFSFRMGASIGYTTLENTTDVPDDVLSVADKALYEAKAKGKGQVVRGYVSGDRGQ